MNSDVTESVSGLAVEEDTQIDKIGLLPDVPSEKKKLASRIATYKGSI